MRFINAFLLCMASALSMFAGTQSVTVKANISGLQKGDTILICREELLDSVAAVCDTLPITKKNNFVYKKNHAGGAFYTFIYRPADRTEGRNRNLTLFLNEGTVKLKGDAAHFGMVEKEGGEYEHPSVARYTYLQDSLSTVESDLYDRYDLAMKQGDSGMLKDVLLEISKGQSCPELDSLSIVLANEINDSEYAAAVYVWNSTLSTSGEMENRLSEFIPAVRDSYTAGQIRKVAEMKKKVEPEAQAPDFTLVDGEGETVSLQDYRGKYLLLFHWGVSQGSFRINTEVEQIYTMFHDRGLEILDFVHSDVQPGNFLSYSPELYRQLNPLFHHLWRTVYTAIPENFYVCDRYLLNAIPLLILISPEGKILIRNFGKSGEILKVLSRSLPG